MAESGTPDTWLIVSYNCVLAPQGSSSNRGVQIFINQLIVDTNDSSA